MQYQQRLPGDPAQPKVHGHGRARQIIPRPSGDFNVRLLQHIRRIDPPLEPPIEPKFHHPLQPGAVAQIQLPQRGFVSALDAPLQFDQLAGFFRHDGFHEK
jgi:hypothetical protein